MVSNDKIKPVGNISQEPISLATAQLHLRLDLLGSPPVHPDDSLVTALITAVRQDAENHTGIAVANQSYALALDNFPKSEIQLGIWPVTQITAITYIDRDNSTITVSAGDYTLDQYKKPSVIHPVIAWPDTKEIPNAVIVTFRAGFTDGMSPNNYPLPKTINQAMLMLLGHLYERREAVNVGSSVNDYPLGYEHLLTFYRIHMGM